MISIKGGTQTWSTATKDTISKPDSVQNLAAGDMEKALQGNADVGELLNKISDPNWVDPKKMRKVGSDTLDKDAFLKLFLAQLKNQDPTNPMESHELAAQLAQFTQLEKLNNIDEGISKMANQKDPNQSYDALNLIGKSVAGDSSKIMRATEGEKHEISFTLPVDAKDVNVKVMNRFGEEVKNLTLKGLTAGKNSVEWDGRNADGRTLGMGDYMVQIEALNSSGKKVHAETKFEGRVTGVNYTPEGPVLLLGKQSVRLAEVRKITEGSQVAQKVNKVVAEESKNPAAATVMKEEKDAKAASAGASNLESVGMSRGLIGKLNNDSQRVVKGVN